MKELSAILASAALQKDMHARMDINEPGWTFWEHRNINIHRVVGFLRAAREYPDARALDAELRGAMARHFKRAWWRGIAYGVVANVGALAPSPEDLKILGDAYENAKGTMQWVILIGPDARTATGVHTWVEGFLSPVYRSVLQSLSGKGCQVASVMKEKDGVLRFLTAVADGRVMAQTGRPAFSEFRDPFRTDKRS